MDRPNVLFITLDQFRGDCLSGAGHPVVRTPALDHLADHGVRFARHYAQAAPCAPGRAALYTGTYQMTNRVVANGTPLDDRFDNVARAARRAGYRPALFGYTDQGVDPRLVDDPADPRLFTYESVLPGFDTVLDLPGHCDAWLRWLASLGYQVGDPDRMLATEHLRPEDHSITTFLTNHLIQWLNRQDGPWFAHASYLRPHPPYSAAGRFAGMYDPDDCPDAVPVGDHLHPLHRVLLDYPATAAPADPDDLRRLRAAYYGMISEVDAQLDRVWTWLVDNDQWDDTVIVVTADHGEQLGDQGILEKAGYHEPSYHVLGLVRDPSHPGGNGTVVEHFTEAVDVMPTLCEAMGVEVPAQCDGYPLTPFLDGTDPPHWREAAHWEWDWRDVFLPDWDPAGWPWDRTLEHQHLAVRRSRDRAYVHFGDGTWLCFDLAADPTWRTVVEDPTMVLPEAQAMLDWRARHRDRTMTGMLLQEGGIGRRPVTHPAGT